MTRGARAALYALVATAALGGGRGAAAQPRARAAPDSARMLTLLRDRDGMVPLPAGVRLLSLTVAAPADARAGDLFDATLRAAGFEVEALRLPPDATAPAAVVEAPAHRADVVVLGVYVDALSTALLDFLLRSELDRPTLVIAFGGPAVLSNLPGRGTYLIAAGRDEHGQHSAAQGLAGLEPVLGTLAADLPPFRAGEGLRREGPAGVVGIPRTAQAMPMAINFIEVDPARAGMDEAVLDGLDQLLRNALADSAAPGAALAIGRRGQVVRLRGYGTVDYADVRPVSPATIFDLASLTKVVATTTAAMILEGEGRLELDAPVARYLSWWSQGDARKARVTVRQLFVHRAGFTAFRPWYRDRHGADGYRAALAAEKLEAEPGTRTLYSDIDFIALGMVVEAIAGMPLDRFVQERVLGPLGMEDTSFRPHPQLLPRIAPTEVDTVYRHTHVRGVVHDENAYAMGGVAGHAGLFSTVWDLAIFADLLLNDGLLPACAPKVASGVACTRPRADSLRVLSPGTVERWTRRQDPGSSYALGWDTPEGINSSAGVFFGERAFGHTGFTGTSIWIDPDLDLYVVLLSNRVNPTRANDRHLALRRAVADAAARAVLDREVVRRR